MPPDTVSSGLARGTLDSLHAPIGGRYRVERPFGRGGMASVWLARDRRLHRSVAIKVLSDALARDEVQVARFRREARLACAISHPNLVAGYEWGDHPRPYLVMEYVDGPSLAELLVGPNGFRGDARVLARELLAALAWLHDRGIVHGDVKPGNVLIASDGSARLTDLGIAQPRGAARLVRPGRVLGTLAYMAPEVRRGEPITARSHLYGAGTVISHCAERLDTPLRTLVEALTASEPGDRLASAHDALSLPRGRCRIARTAGHVRARPGQTAESVHAIACTRHPAHDTGIRRPRSAQREQSQPVAASVRQRVQERSAWDAWHDAQDGSERRDEPLVHPT